MYGSFSYFSGKTSISNLKLLTWSNFLKFLIEKKSLKSNLRLQLAQIEGSEVKTSDNKIHHFSITKLGKRRKKGMSELIETIIIRAQQDFDVAGGLNPIQIEIKDDRVTNILNKYENDIYKITPLGILFPASVTNNTSQIFVLRKKLSGVKTSILNKKLFDILAVIDLNKINNWNDIKGQSIWTNAAIRDQEEINNNNHLCFPFITRYFSNLTSFSFFIQDDSNKKIEFNSGEKKQVFLIFKSIFS